MSTARPKKSRSGPSGRSLTEDERSTVPVKLRLSEADRGALETLAERWGYGPRGLARAAARAFREALDRAPER
jgi:hypothetical protein